MTWFHRALTGGIGTIALLLAADRTRAQTHHATHRPLGSDVIVPQVRRPPTGEQSDVRVTEVTAGIAIVEQLTTTTARS